MGSLHFIAGHAAGRYRAEGAEALPLPLFIAATHLLAAQVRCLGFTALIPRGVNFYG